MASASSSSPPAATDAGQERVMAAAKHIVKSMAVSKNAADDMIRFLATYNSRLLPLSSPEDGEEASGRGYDEEEEELIASAVDVIRRCNSSSSSSSGMTDYLYAVDDAIAAAPHSARAAAAVHAAMPRLEEEVRSLLCSSLRRLSLPSDDVDDSTPYASPRHGALSPQAAASIRGFANRMLHAGYGPELAQVYVAVRRNALAESVAHLGVETVAIEEVLKMEWPVLDQMMRRWSHAVRVVVRTLLAGELWLCDEVFESDEELGHECFADVARGCVLQLLGFADAVAMSARAVEKLFRTLGMYEALTDVQQELKALFAGGAAREFIAGEVSSAVALLGSTVCHTIEEFSHAIHGEASRRPVNGGEIHPMARYVLNYCGLLADCRSTLDTILGDGGLDDTVEASTDGAAAPTPSARCMRELLTLLLRKIDDKSRLYDDAGLQNIFLMNNLYYVVQKVMESPPLRELLGDDWLRRHRGQIRQYEAGYLRASWIAVLSLLRDDGGPANTSAAQKALRDKARSFNAAFEELYRTQTAWKVSHPQLREELRIAVSERVIPAYRPFLGRASRLPARHVKYSLEDLENYMLDFFEGVQKFVR
ncbi:exocyst complex component EXO70B1-like [Phragmites australis]|uniref:exocyst complex component EXO70B1-like n=1 Tax=Phragmites australis TaxID=29695 RepID=UPI002D767C0A|nr:exocyst complex component EXO70B1-like [Phragmites australis]